MTDPEIKMNLINNYINLLRIKAHKEELDIQIEAVKMNLTSYSIDTTKIERMILGQNDS